MKRKETNKKEILKKLQAEIKAAAEAKAKAEKDYIAALHKANKIGRDNLLYIKVPYVKFPYAKIPYAKIPYAKIPYVKLPYVKIMD